jgi:hypothetical protein
VTQLDPGDARLIADAANRGKISVDNLPEWILAMRADPAGTRATIAKLAPFQPRVSDAASVVYASVGVEDALRSMGLNAPRGSVSAAPALPAAPGSAVPQLQYDSAGLPVPPIPAPVRLVSGKDPEAWSKTERDNALLREMFPGLRDRIPPAPGGAGYYQPTPNQRALPVQLENGDVEWVPNPNYRPGD